MSGAHSNLEGISNCTKCHDLGNQVLDKKCLDCHTNVQDLISAKRGYHASSAVKNKNCRDCHSEHFGRDFKLIRFDEKKFDHSLTKFILTGQHIKIDCGKCHSDQIRKRLNRKSKTYLGLSSDCVSCHEDIHLGFVGNDCNTCHNTNSFVKAELFDHNKTGFRLLQAHSKVNCEKCHPKSIKNGKILRKYSGLNFSNCFPCHNDVHNNKFGKDCKSCHVVAGFRFVNKNAFDHEKTRFPLLGRHSTVSCNSCHKTSITSKLSFEHCTDCHTDYHSGEFTEDENTQDCSNCHNVHGFSPSFYTLEDHQKLSFPLQGKHLAVECRQCHFKENKWQFTIEHNECIDCHTNVHKNEISEKISVVNGCRTCHNVNSWGKVEFDHSLTRFALSGKHSLLDCRKCHYNETEGTQYFSSLESACESCHKDQHGGQFQKDNKTDCERCHSTDGWKPSNFDHNLTRFKLNGRHESVACIKCHPKINSEGSEYIIYKQENIKCSACHS